MIQELQELEEKLGQTVVAYHNAIKQVKKDSPEATELATQFQQIKNNLGSVKATILINTPSQE